MSSSSLSCYCEQRELVLTAIERTLGKKGDSKNVLSYGFCLMSPDPFSQRCGLNVENRYPNSGVNRLFYPAWEILLTRIGDTLMTYLLEQTSLYIYATTDCLVQLTGTPLHNLIKSNKNEGKKMTPKMFKIKTMPGVETNDIDGNIKNNEINAVAVKEAEQKQRETNLKYLETADTSCDLVKEVINLTGVTNRSKEVYLRNKQAINCEQIETDHLVENRTRSDTGKEMLQTSKLYNNSVYRKKKRKYEEITETRFLDLKRASEVYKISKKHTSDVGSENADVHNITGRIAMFPRKRKIVEEECYNHDSENSEPMKSNTKYIRLEKPNHRLNEDVGNIENYKGGENIEELNTQESIKFSKNAKDKGEKSCKTLPKLKRRSRQSKKKTLTSVQVKDHDYSFCPYEFHLPLARNNALFTRNPRERLSKSALLSRLDSTFEDVILLCKEVFCDTKVFTSSQVKVILPDFSLMFSTVNIPNDCTIPLHPVKNHLNSKNNVHHNGHSGCIIGGNYSPCDHGKQTLAMPEDVDCDASSSFRVSLNQNNKQTKLSGDTVVVNVGSGECNVSTELIGECKQEYQNIHVDDDSVHARGVINTYSGKESKKVQLLAKRKYEILKRRNAEVNWFSEDHELNMLGSTEEKTYSNFARDTAMSPISTQVNNSMVDNIRKSVITVGDTILSSVPDVCTEKSATLYKGKTTPCSLDAEIGLQGREPVLQNTPTIDASILSGVVPFLKQFIENHRTCPYRAMVNHHCPTVVYKTKTSYTSQRTRHGILRNYGSTSLSKLLSSHHHPRKVYLFLRACILKVLPVEMIGTKHNLNILLKSLLIDSVADISKLLSLGKNDRLTLGQLMNGIKTKEVDWLRTSTSNCVKLHLMARLIHWLFHYILSLLKMYFYITDTGFLRYRLVYYRQATWNRLHIQGFKDLIQRKILKTVSQNKVLDGLQKKATLGISVLRFLPKQQALRPIINMGSSMYVDSFQTRSVNKQISDLHCVLTYLKNKNPSLIGHGILGTDGIYKSWRGFVGRWRSYGCPRLYFVKTDICKCYDTINQNKLYDIMENILTTKMNDEEYIVRKYFIVRLKDGKLVRKFQRDVLPLSEFDPDFSSFCARKAEKDMIKNAIFVDKVVYQHETCESLLRTLKIHLCNNFVKVGNQYCLQTSGISQGSIISTLLCSFYYADMEKKVLKITDRDLLVRLVDDYLYITPSHNEAVNFLRIIISGIPEYSCSTNKEKILTNFRWEGNELPMVSTDWFPWCGTYFNTRTLEVRFDFAKYAGFSMKDTVSIELSTNPGKSLKEKILFSIKQKCHKMFIDASINYERQMLKNVYQMFMLAVFKLHTHIKYLTFNRREHNNSNFLIGVIKEMIDVVKKLVGKYLQCNEGCMSRSLDAVTWLCLKACIVKLSRHHGQYKHLLKQINKQLNHKQENMTKTDLDEVNAVVGVGIPVEFYNILP